MGNNTIKTELPENYEELKKAANRTASWKSRYDAVVELGKYNHSQEKDILRTTLANDPVYKVQEAAFQSLLDFGEEAQLPKRKKFELVKGANKVFVRVKKSLPKDHTFEEFLTTLKRMRIDVYDTYEGDKGDEFKTWLENEWSSLK